MRSIHFADMEIHETVNAGYEVAFHRLFARLAYIILCFRGYFSGIIEDTLAITLFLNLIIVCAIDYRHVRKAFFIFAALSLLTVYNKDVLALIDILALIYVLRGTPLSYLTKVNAVVLTIYTCIWLFLLQTRVLRDELMVMPKGVAHCMGYENPNQFGMLGFYIIASLFLILPRKWKILVFLVIPLINEAFFHLSVARTPWLGGYVIMIVILLSSLRLLRPFLRYFIGILPIFIFGALIYFAKQLPQYPELDIIFTTRFSNYANLLNSMSPLNWIIGTHQIKGIIVDSSYFMILCSGGIMCIILFFGAFYKAIVKRWNYLSPYLPFLIATLAIGVGENAFSSANALSFIFWYLIFEYGKRQKTISDS